MSGTVEITGAGLAICDADGARIGHVSLISGSGTSTLVMSVRGDLVEAEMTREQVRRFEDVVHRVGLEALFAGAGDPVDGRVTPRVPRIPHHSV